MSSGELCRAKPLLSLVCVDGTYCVDVTSVAISCASTVTGGAGGGGGITPLGTGIDSAVDVASSAVRSSNVSLRVHNSYRTPLAARLLQKQVELRPSLLPHDACAHSLCVCGVPRDETPLSRS